MINNKILHSIHGKRAQKLFSMAKKTNTNPFNTSAFNLHLTKLIITELDSIRKTYGPDGDETPADKEFINQYKNCMLKYCTTKTYKGPIYGYDLNKEYLYLMLQLLPYGKPLTPQDKGYGLKINFLGNTYKADYILRSFALNLIDILYNHPQHKDLVKGIYVRVVGHLKRNPSSISKIYSPYTSYITAIYIGAQCRNHVLRTIKANNIELEDILHLNTDGITLIKPIKLYSQSKIGDGRLDYKHNGTFMAKAVAFYAIGENNKQVQYYHTSLYRDDYIKNYGHLKPVDGYIKPIERDFINFNYNVDHTSHANEQIGTIEETNNMEDVFKAYDTEYYEVYDGKEII